MSRIGKQLTAQRVQHETERLERDGAKEGGVTGAAEHTGEVAVCPVTVKRHSDTPRVMVVPSASVNSAVRSEVSRRRRQMASGSTVKTAPCPRGSARQWPAPQIAPPSGHG